MTPEERRETFQRFIEAVEDGESVREACKLAGSHWRTLSNWMADTTNVTEGGEPFHARYTRARIISAEGFAERALTTALDAKDAQLARLQVDTLKWRAAMANPKAWGDRQHVEVSGGIEHLHLDALRSISAKARIDNSLPSTTSPKLLGVTTSDAQPIDTVADLDTE